MIKHVVIALFFLACASTVSAGGAPPAAYTAMVRVERSGGLCASGQMCSRIFTLRADGSYTTVGDARHRGSGMVTGAELSLLRRQVVALRAGSLVPRPKGTVCEIAYDGTMTTYTFTTGGRVSTFTTCQVIIPAHTAPFVALSAVLARYAGF